MNTKKPLGVSFIVFCVFFILLFLVLISTWKMTGIVAKFASTDSATDEARVAKFIYVDKDVTFTDNITIKFDPTMASQTYQITINNTGETVVNCDVECSSLNVLPLDISVDSSDFNLDCSGTKTVTITINWDKNVIDYNSYTYSNLVDLLTIKVTCTQID
ncbi:MAG: hypothetical protein IJX78_07125 [Bacilli bacterium]|nr:hypothetical protein [Bacilli bacterium]